VRRRGQPHLTPWRATSGADIADAATNLACCGLWPGAQVNGQCARRAAGDSRSARAGDLVPVDVVGIDLSKRLGYAEAHEVAASHKQG